MKDDKRLAGSRRLRQSLGWGIAPEARSGVPESTMNYERGEGGKCFALMSIEECKILTISIP